MTTTEFTHDDLSALLMEQSQGDEMWAFTVARQIGQWVERGDAAAFYRNQDFGHPDQGDVKIVSFGSHLAQLEVAEPPERLPDIGDQINWRYGLIGTFRGSDA